MQPAAVLWRDACICSCVCTFACDRLRASQCMLRWPRLLCCAVACRRDNSEIYAVNTIKFHPVHGTFATAGGDGTYNFWDKDSKQRLRVRAAGLVSWAWDMKQKMQHISPCLHASLQAHALCCGCLI